MKSYRMMWWTVTTVLIVIGSTVAVLFTPAAGPVLAGVLAGAVGFVAIPFVVVPGRQPGWVTRLGGTVYGSLVGAALIGLAVLLGSGSASLMLVLVVVILAVPLVPGWLMKRLTAELLPEYPGSHRTVAPTVVQPAAASIRPVAPVGPLGESVRLLASAPVSSAPHASGDPTSSPGTPAQQVDADPAGLTDDQLCRAWRTSFTALQRRPDAVQRDVLTTARTGYLDELERRDPAGFARWIAAGARAASNPSRYRTLAARPAVARPGSPGTKAATPDQGPVAPAAA